MNIKKNTNFNSDAIRWARDYLVSKDYVLKNNLPETIQNTPWSYVARFTTPAGFIYLKQTPAQLALEAPIIKLLRNNFQAPVPIVITQNTSMSCFLMKDAGNSLRTILQQNFDCTLLAKAIQQFASLQIKVAKNISVFFDVGVPDWRLAKFSELYQNLLDQKNILIAEGLSAVDLEKLKKLTPTVSKLCQKLSSYAIESTLVQPDFNDNNTLIDNTLQKITFIDLGEISISHPFFSLLNCLQVIKKYYALSEEDVTYLQIKDNYFANYTNFESKARLQEAFEIARLLSPIYRTLAGYRLINACDSSAFAASFAKHTRPGLFLRELFEIQN